MAGRMNGRGRHRTLAGRLGRGLALVAAVALAATLALAVGRATPTLAADDWVLTDSTCGVVQSVLVPPGVREVTIEAVGGWGGLSGIGQGGATAYGVEGFSAKVVAMFAVTPGQSIRAVVGCTGAYGGPFDNTAPTPGWSQGGGAGRGNTSAFESGVSAGAGGGATGVCIGTGPCSPTSGTTVVVAGGGGGGPTYNCAGILGLYAGGGGGYGTYTAAGGGGGPSGENGDTGNGLGGTGGVNSAGGSPDGATSANGSGASGVNVVGGGGGGGYVGGAAGGHYDQIACLVGGGGGGGSSWVHDSATSRAFLTDVIYPSGVRVAFAEPVFDPTTTILTATPNPSDVGEAVTFTAQVTSDGDPVTSGGVDFTVDGAPAATNVTVDGTGRASFTSSTLTPGPHAVVATFVATGTHAGSTDTLTHQVVVPPVASTTTVEGPPATTVYGETADFTVTVSSGGAPITTGSVELDADGAHLGTLALDATGTATWSTDAWEVGLHVVQGRYLGTSEYAASAGNDEHRVVPTPTTVTVMPVPDGGRARTGTATEYDVAVTTAAGDPVPGGTVDVEAGTTFLAAGLSLTTAGTARFSAASLPVGEHLIVVRYPGDTNHAASEATRSHLVEAPPPPDDPPGPADPPAPPTGTPNGPSAHRGTGTTGRSGSALPRTGGGLIGPIGGGAGLVLLGAGIVVLTARRRLT